MASRKRPAENTASVEWRQRGNKIYCKDRDGLPFSIRSDRLEQAKMCYLNAVQMSTSQEEKSSANKNTAVAAARLARVYQDKESVTFDAERMFQSQQRNTPKSYFQHVKSQYETALNHFKEALECSDGRDDLWITNVFDATRTCFDNAVEWAASKPNVEKRLLTETFVRHLPEGIMKADGYILLANFLFHLAVETTQNREYKHSLHYLGDCYYPVEEARRWIQKCPRLETEVNVLEADVCLLTSVAKGLQAKATGDQLLKDCVEDEVDLNIDMVWSVIDWYQNAIQLTRGNEVELEAEIQTNLGYVYDKVLKMPARAYSAYQYSINLAQTLYPKNLGNTKWFKNATVFLEAYQRERLQRMEEREKELTDPVREELKPEIEKLNKQRDVDVKDCLEFIYSTWPPKNPDHKLEMTGYKTDEDTYATKKTDKKLLQKALQHYHPDTQDKEKHGLKWVVLAEEITKILTQKYNCIKLPD